MKNSSCEQSISTLEYINLFRLSYAKYDISFTFNIFRLSFKYNKNYSSDSMEGFLGPIAVNIKNTVRKEVENGSTKAKYNGIFIPNTQKLIEYYGC